MFWHEQPADKRRKIEVETGSEFQTDFGIDFYRFWADFGVHFGIENGVGSRDRFLE